jgi:hypothetical protein
MNNTSRLLLLSLLVFPLALGAQQGPRGPGQGGPGPRATEGQRAERPERPNRAERPEQPAIPMRDSIDPETAEILMLGRLVEMPDQQLANLEEGIKRVRAMSPEEKEAIRNQIADLRSERRGNMAERMEAWQAVPEETRDRFGRALRQMTPQERQNLRERMRDMSPEERRDEMRRLGSQG